LEERERGKRECTREREKMRARAKEIKRAREKEKERLGEREVKRDRIKV